MLTEAIEAERGAGAATAVGLVVIVIGTTTALMETSTAVAPAGLVPVPALPMTTVITARLVHVHVGAAETMGTDLLGVIADAAGREAAARPPSLLKMNAIGAPSSCNSWQRDSERRS